MRDYMCCGFLDVHFHDNRPGMLSSPRSVARQTMTSDKLLIGKSWDIGSVQSPCKQCIVQNFFKKGEKMVE